MQLSKKKYFACQECDFTSDQQSHKKLIDTAMWQSCISSYIQEEMSFLIEIKICPIVCGCYSQQIVTL